MTSSPENSTLTRLEKKNLGRISSAEFLWGFKGGLVAPSTVLTLLLLDLGAGTGSVGVVSAIEGGAILFPQIFGAYLFRRRRPTKQVLILWHVLSVVPLLCLMGLLLQSCATQNPATTRVGLLLCFGGIQMVMGIVVPAWIEWLSHIFAPRTRGVVLGAILSSAAGGGILGALLAGQLIRLDPRPEAYARHYFLAGIIAAIAMAIFMAVQSRSSEIEVDAVADENGSPLERQSLRDWLRWSARDGNMRAFLAGRVLTIFGFSVLPFLAAHFTMPTAGGLSKSFIVSCGAVQFLGMALSQVCVGRLGDGRGHRLGLIIAAGLQVLTLLILLSGSGALFCLLVYLGVGAAVGSAKIAELNLLIETCPHQSRTAHIAVGNLMLGAAMITAPLLAGVVVGRWGLPALFAASLAFSMAGVLWLLRRFQEPRQWRPTTVPSL